MPRCAARRGGRKLLHSGPEDGRVNDRVAGYRARRCVTPQQRSWLVPASLALLCVLGAALGPTYLRYERGLVAAEPWRLLTGHIAHLGWIHLTLNLAGLAATWALLGRLLHPLGWSVAILACALLISGALYLLDTTLDWYVGLSGVLHGLFALGTAAGLRTRPVFHGLLLLGVVTKVAWEQLGPAAGSAELVGGSIVVNAHLYGLVAGLACLPVARLGQPGRKAAGP